ncbi:MAG TPA: hypothetical protein RMH85_21015 [Polyangiaceae bacterium LLY-WYZ-15_(1-7)]|nr:hypothetical protein [Myxococcales bacterium]MAT24575.1 hypothetical protein [Sandaracinus sp.]MBJ75376.1 hypothetical protein [Sandaracinus sp.]HJL04491.1 hypothetical protein [Polyangiaceae bacterium LLY-WYZ-15_(1-7)]HJL10969.1 hypothetical protein [Polyangiaceae bacterium LLY-WYZ-15_(1-7)]
MNPEATPGPLDAPVRDLLDDAAPAELEALDAHLGRAWSGLPEARLDVEPGPVRRFVVLRRTGPESWLPVEERDVDGSTPVPPGPSLLAALDRAATEALGSSVDVQGLSAFRFLRVVEGEAGPGEIALADARRDAPDFQVGDEHGRHEPEATAQLRSAIVRGLRARVPLVLADDPAPRETVRQALAEEGAELGRPIAELARGLVDAVGVPLADLDPAVARAALDLALREAGCSVGGALVPLTPARSAALVAELLALARPSG